MAQMNPETEAIINDEKMTDTEMAIYLIQRMSLGCLSEDSQIRENWVSIGKQMGKLALKKMTNPYARKLLGDALENFRRFPVTTRSSMIKR